MKLTDVNVACEAFADPPNNWRFDLHASDGSCWTVERGMSEYQATLKACEFSRFSGLPVLKHGNPLTLEDVL